MNMASSKINSLNRIFTRTMLRHFINGEDANIYISVINRYVSEPEHKNNRELIHDIYCELRDNYRNEYFYKNSMLNKWLLGVHSVNTTTALTELPIANSKADFVLVNGEAVVYEIKTELDNLDRLNEQIIDYFKAFNQVAIVTYEENLQQLKKMLDVIDKPVGIYLLKKNGALSRIKKPEKFADDLNKEIIFKLLRKGEYENILLQKYGKLPGVTQFKYYSVCKDMLLEIPLAELYQSVLCQLKMRTKLEKPEFLALPYELKFLAYFMDLTVEDYQKLDVFLEQQYGGI